MAKLCDPDIDMVFLDGANSPEPSIREMIIHYYVTNDFGRLEAADMARELIEIHDHICKKALRLND